MAEKRKQESMEALLFEMRWGKLAKAYISGKRNVSGYWKKGGPVALKQVPIPSIITESWILVKTEYCGICGSDMKELTLKGARDNPLRSLISFPQILGHEPVGTIVKKGRNVNKIKIGDRVALSPWFPCKPRGINIECSRCQIGDYVHCHNFQKGALPIGMHLGTTRGFGGFAPYISVHESQCFLIPDNVSFEKAVLADPFAVAFHSLLILDPREDSTILVYGIGIIGLLVILLLNKIFKVKKIIAVGRYQFQKEMALNLGAKHVFMSSGEKLLDELIEFLNVESYKPERGSKWTMDGVDGILDTIASADTLEIGIRILTTQAKLVFLGVSTPKRFENTLHYFKELEIIGSNAFSLEYFEGRRVHAFEYFMEFLKSNRINPSALISHKFPLKEYKTAFDVLADKSKSHAIKVLFTFNDIK